MEGACVTPSVTISVGLDARRRLVLFRRRPVRNRRIHSVSRKAAVNSPVANVTNYPCRALCRAALPHRRHPPSRSAAVRRFASRRSTSRYSATRRPGSRTSCRPRAGDSQFPRRGDPGNSHSGQLLSRQLLPQTYVNADGQHFYDYVIGPGSVARIARNSTPSSTTRRPSK